MNDDPRQSYVNPEYFEVPELKPLTPLTPVAALVSTQKEEEVDVRPGGPTTLKQGGVTHRFSYPPHEPGRWNGGEIEYQKD